MPDAVPITNKLVPIDLGSRINQVTPSSFNFPNQDFPDFENKRSPYNLIDTIPPQNPLSGPLPLHCMVNVNIQFGPLPVDSAVQLAFGTADADAMTVKLEAHSIIDI